jgi:hypothetical protein
VDFWKSGVIEGHNTLWSVVLSAIIMRILKEKHRKNDSISIKNSTPELRNAPEPPSPNYCGFSVYTLVEIMYLNGWILQSETVRIGFPINVRNILQYSRINSTLPNDFSTLPVDFFNFAGIEMSASKSRSCRGHSRCKISSHIVKY